MRKKLSIQKFAVLLTSAFFTITVLVACSKDPHSDPPPAQLSKLQLLVKSKWQVDEVLRNIDGTNSHYRRGVINDTGIDYDTLQVTFNSDGTGLYQDELGITHPATWEFTSNDFRNLTLVVGLPGSQTFDWQLVEITSEALHNTTAVGTGILVSARYTPLPRDFPDK